MIKRAEKTIDSVFRAENTFWIILIAAFLARILLCFVIKSHSDMVTFGEWARVAAEKGLSKFYLPGSFSAAAPDYPPAYIYILWIIGNLHSILNIVYGSALSIILFKLPAMVCDILCGVLLYQKAKERRSVKMANILFFLFVFNPAVWFNSTIWGQVDSVSLLFFALAFVDFSENKWTRGAVWLMISVLIKPQAVIFAPVFLLLVIKNWSFKNAVRAFLAAAGVFVILLLPFSAEQLGDPLWIVRLYNNTLFVTHPYASQNAANFYALIGANKVSIDNAFLFADYKFWGAAAIVIITFAVFWFYAKQRKKDNAAFYLLACFLIAAFYTLSIKVHERYIFPFFLLSLFYYLYSGRKWIFTVLGGFTLVNFINLAIIAVRKNEALFDYLLRADSLVQMIFFVILCAFVWKMTYGKKTADQIGGLGEYGSVPKR